jgi:hypothetical protein
MAAEGQGLGQEEVLAGKRDLSRRAGVAENPDATGSRECLHGRPEMA